MVVRADKPSPMLASPDFIAYAKNPNFLADCLIQPYYPAGLIAWVFKYNVQLIFSE